MTRPPYRRKQYWNEPEMGWYEKAYLPEILKGLAITGGVFLRNMAKWMTGKKGALTTYYPEETRWDYARPEDQHGIAETCRVDQCLHSLFGASKLAADVMVQEYGRYFGMKTCCLRGGCLTGPNHCGVEPVSYTHLTLPTNREV